MSQIFQSLRGESLIRIPFSPAADGKNQFFRFQQLDVPSPSFDAFQQIHELIHRRINAVMSGDADDVSSGQTGSYAADASRRNAGPQTRYVTDGLRISSTLSNKTV